MSFSSQSNFKVTKPKLEIVKYSNSMSFNKTLTSGSRSRSKSVILNPVNGCCDTYQGHQF